MEDAPVLWALFLPWILLGILQPHQKHGKESRPLSFAVIEARAKGKMRLQMSRKSEFIALLCAVSIAAIGIFVCVANPKYGKWLEAIGPISILIGGAFAYWKYGDSVEMRRRDVLRRLLNDFHDKGYDATFYELAEREGVDDWYSGDLSFLSTDYERRVDAMLRFFEDILNMRELSRLISESEFKYFKYYLDRISEDSSFCKYLADLDEFCKSRENPLKYVTEYVRSQAKLVKKGAEPKKHEEPSDGVDVENVLRAYFMNKDGCITRSARSVISRMRTVAKAVERLVSAKCDKEEFCKKALEYINTYPLPKVAASLRSALRHWHRAAFNTEPKC